MEKYVQRSEDPVINLTFIRHFLNARHSPGGSLNHHKIPKIVTIILCFIENETETQKIKSIMQSVSGRAKI